MTVTDSMFIGTCAFCRQGVPRGVRYFCEVTGWEIDKRPGGTNAIRLRKRSGAVAHKECVDRAVAGRDGQMTLSEQLDTLTR